MAGSGRVGVWLVGARGSVATTAQVGASALAAGLLPPTGLVTALDAFANVPLPGLADLVFGGHDVGSHQPLRKGAELLADAGVLPAALLPAVGDHLDACDARIREGVDPTSGEAPTGALARLTGDLEQFRATHDLGSVVVVNLASTESVVAMHPSHASGGELRAALGRGEPVLPASSLYALAAVDAGCAYVNFTPSTGLHLPALQQLAAERGTLHAGRDGKTGETLVKTALAPMFADRNLRVQSWAGTNLLGGGDGRALADPERAASKLVAKERCLPDVLGYRPQMPLSIEYVEDLGEWKTAWDHIRFTGFLGTAMTMQFTWQGCDSALAAPLVLDLVRLTTTADRAGESGELTALNYFFKEPGGQASHRLQHQYDALVAWARNLPTA